jgi:hypothetical protein
MRLLGVVLPFAFIVGVAAQSPSAEPRFEVTSVKQSRTDTSRTLCDLPPTSATRIV